jgi:ketosteroid isomerase-like protein
MSDAETLVRTYYDCLDSGEYDRLTDVLAPDFTQERPDRTFSGREEFVEFMREQRPRTDTTHPIETVYRASDEQWAVKGRLVADDETLTGFVDLFTLEDSQIRRIETYTD